MTKQLITGIANPMAGLNAFNAQNGITNDEPAEGELVTNTPAKPADFSPLAATERQPAANDDDPSPVANSDEALTPFNPLEG